MVTRLVLLPGMHGTGELFSEFMRAMPEPKHIEAPCYPKDVILSYEQLLKGVQAFAPESEGYFLLAESFSTPLAIQFAATGPANLKGLILCAGFASSPLKGWRRFVVRSLAPLMFRLAASKLVINLLAGPDAPADLVVALKGAISAAQPRVLAGRLRAVLDCDTRAELSQIEVPILYLQAKQDDVVPALCLEEILDIRPDVNVFAIDGPHLLLQRESVKAAAAVSAFIEKLESVG